VALVRRGDERIDLRHPLFLGPALQPLAESGLLGRVRAAGMLQYVMPDVRVRDVRIRVLPEASQEEIFLAVPRDLPQAGVARPYCTAYFVEADGSVSPEEAAQVHDAEPAVILMKEFEK